MSWTPASRLGRGGSRSRMAAARGPRRQPVPDIDHRLADPEIPAQQVGPEADSREDGAGGHGEEAEDSEYALQDRGVVGVAQCILCAGDAIPGSFSDPVAEGAGIGPALHVEPLEAS